MRGLRTFQIKAASSCWTETTSTFSNPMSLKEVGKVGEGTPVAGSRLGNDVHGDPEIAFLLNLLKIEALSLFL
ncbi:MAG: hypothetical protein CSA81_00535 [Acidobacteria bacterium]|nr:MAG: hypothetical protein CSA81_00535 [Acidobacteriota bacterium]